MCEHNPNIHLNLVEKIEIYLDCADLTPRIY